MDKNDQVEIVKCKRSELHIVLDLVQELAEFEKEPNAVIATLNDYTSAFDDNIFEVICAKIDGKIVGITLFYMTFSTWKGKMMYLEDFYVKPSYRKFGIGQKLFDSFLKYSKKEGCKLVKWQVLDWNKIGLNFYEKNNAIIEKEWWNGKIVF